MTPLLRTGGTAAHTAALLRTRVHTLHTGMQLNSFPWAFKRTRITRMHGSPPPPPPVYIGRTKAKLGNSGITQGAPPSRMCTNAHTTHTGKHEQEAHPTWPNSSNAPRALTRRRYARHTWAFWWAASLRRWPVPKCAC